MLAALLFSPHAFAQSPPQGFNSVGDVAPFGANGATLMDIYNDKQGHQGVGVNIGTGQPQAMFQVNGGILLGSQIPGSTIQVGQPCGPSVVKGTIAYDSAEDKVLYCNASGSWASALGGGASCPTTINSAGTSYLGSYPPGSGYPPSTGPGTSYPDKTVITTTINGNYTIVGPAPDPNCGQGQAQCNNGSWVQTVTTPACFAN